MESGNDIGEYIKEARRIRGLSRPDLAELADTHTDTIWGLESGRHAPRPSTLRRLAKGLGVEVSDITTGNLEALTDGAGKARALAPR
ncbi:MAG: helix-turn-helix domain-containing protein [Actinomycetota bacterium]|nr:helix-turn-helix domain-containing protein [Actinomycetota bacterium]